MKTYTFRVTQDLVAFYEGEVQIEAKSKKEAEKIVSKMTTKELDEIAYGWEQNTDNAEAVGEIEVHDEV